jgi:hypothetical protein
VLVGYFFFFLCVSIVQSFYSFCLLTKLSFIYLGENAWVGTGKGTIAIFGIKESRKVSVTLLCLIDIGLFHFGVLEIWWKTSL